MTQIKDILSIGTVILGAIASVSLGAPTVEGQALTTPNESLLTKRGNYGDTSSSAFDSWEACGVSKALPAFHWLVLLRDREIDPDDCEGGMLDNLRDWCGVITSWECSAAGSEGTTAILDFWTDVGCTEWEVTQALHAASSDKHVDCEEITGSVSVLLPPGF